MRKSFSLVNFRATLVECVRTLLARFLDSLYYFPFVRLLGSKRHSSFLALAADLCPSFSLLSTSLLSISQGFDGSLVWLSCSLSICH